MGILLRGEDTKFVLSALGIDVWHGIPRPTQPGVEASEDCFSKRLDEFFAGEPDVHLCIRRGTAEDRAEACDEASYTLGFEAPARVRTGSCTPQSGAVTIGHIACETGPQHRSSMSCVASIATAAADVWVRVNHVGGDGVPVQEVMTRLAAAFGASKDLCYPTAQVFEPCSSPKPCAGRPELAEVTAFIDFAPLQAWRRRENARLPEPMTVCAAILWCLARHEALAGLHMGTTADVAAIDGMGRGVGLIVVRPADYFDRSDGLAEYVRDFNRELALSRRRERRVEGDR